MLIHNSATEKGLKVVENAPFKVYLGGSRRMKELAAKAGSSKISLSSATDYDYYATYSAAASSYLRDAGFNASKTGHSQYDFDTEVVEMYYCGRCQVVLRMDAEFYKSVFDNIPLDSYYRALWKSSPGLVGTTDAITPLFNALFAVAKATGSIQPNTTKLPVVCDPIKAYEHAMKVVG